MLLYHYTNVENLDSIKKNGLIANSVLPDTLLINMELMASNHPNKINRNKSIFFLPFKPGLKEGLLLLEVNSDSLLDDKLFAANLFYADSLWSTKKYLPDHHSDINDSITSYWDSLSLLKETDLDFNEDDIEVLYNNDIPYEIISNIYES